VVSRRREPNVSSIDRPFELHRHARVPASLVRGLEVARALDRGPLFAVLADQDPHLGHLPAVPVMPPELEAHNLIRLAEVNLHVLEALLNAAVTVVGHPGPRRRELASVTPPIISPDQA
jgi:hypothetical protein